ncbi:MAG: hypothetical protein ACRENK_03900 [Gemmatimonadaceae bacterium]
MQRILDEVGRAAPFASIEEINRVLTARMHEYNATPQAALGGVSPDEMAQLLDGDWISTGALRPQPLSVNELAGAPLLADARTLLDFVASEGPVKETAAHNLPRAVVARLLPRLRMPAQERIAVDIGEPPPLNEGDVVWLPALRHTMMFGGLLMRRKGLRITARGRELLHPDRAGELYALLFLTFFRELDLRVFSADDRHADLQATIAYSFYKLRSGARDWRSAEALAETAWLASAKDPPTEWESHNVDFRYYAFHHRVLGPLVQFGLLGERVLPAEERWKESTEFRVTTLYDRFLRFEFQRQPAREL